MCVLLTAGLGNEHPNKAWYSGKGGMSTWAELQTYMSCVLQLRFIIWIIFRMSCYLMYANRIELWLLYAYIKHNVLYSYFYNA